MPELGDLFGDPAVARWVARAITRDLTQQRRNGLALPPRAVDVLRAMDTAAGDAGLGGRFASETAPDKVVAVPGHGFTSVGSAAAECEVSEQYVRRLASAGRIRAERLGRDWRIDVDSLRNVLRRTA